LRSRVHPLLSFAPSSEYTVTSHLFSTRKRQTPSLGLLRLLRDISAQSPLNGRLPSPTYVPPSAFLTPSTAYSSLHLADLFHPATTSEIHSSGVCPRQPAKSTHRRPVPSCRLRHSPTAELPRPHQIPTLAFRVLIRPPVRCHRQAV
jgi:hypothetical protein